VKIKNLRKKILLSIIDILTLQCVRKNTINTQNIINKIQKQFDVKISSSRMYSILFSLKKQGLVNTKINKKRKLYFLTNKGKIINKSLLKDYVDMQKKIGFF